jgi:pimeloyl-ACP methyl ester carboxylesterase
MVHGGGGHLGWWAEVVPVLADRFDMIVPDLSGHGDSDHRNTYGRQEWVGELAAVLAQEQVRSVRFVGHSMGGLIGIFTAVDIPDLVESLILVDAGLRWPDEVRGSRPRGRGWHPTSVYDTEEEAVARFRLPPGGTTATPELVTRVARYAVRRVPTGWTWKFDPRVSRRFTDEMLHEALPRIACPLGIVYGDESEVSGAHVVDYVASRIGHAVPFTPIENAHHHVPLDRPKACADAIARMIDAIAAAVPPAPR